MPASSCDLLIQAEYILTQDSTRTVIEHGGLAITGDSISAVGPWSSLQEHWTAPRTLDMGASLVMPGLINGHTHAAMTLLRGLADDMPLMEWLTQHIFPTEKHLTPEIVEMGTLLACAEMTRFGSTGFVDMYLLEDAALRAVDSAGLRAQGGEAIFQFPSPAYADTEAGLALARDLHDRWKSHPRISTAIMPHAVYTSTPEILIRCRELAETLDIPLNIHLAETTEETASCLAQFGKRPVPYLYDLGLLSSRTNLAHCVDLTDEEIDILSGCGATIIHNPQSNMKLASGIAPVPALLAKGAKLALGTDGAASNNALNLFREMTVCALLHKVAHTDPTCASAQTVLDMATRGGAFALHRDDVGHLAPGMKADLIALDLRSPNLQPVYNPVSHAVYAANGSEVRLTMVGGEILYEDGRYHKLDYPALLAEARNLRKWVLARAV